MNRVAVKITMLWVFLSASAMLSSPAVLEVRVSVERLEWAHCGKPSSLKTFLKLDLINQSKESRTIGIIQVAQERFWHERRDGKLGLIRASPLPMTSCLRIHQLHLEKRKSNTFLAAVRRRSL